MKLLALDTATEACSVALLITPPGMDRAPVADAGPASPVQGPPPVADLWIVREQEPGRGHAELILSMVQEVLAEGGVRLGDLDALAFGRGPGAFTGVRLAASVIQGLAFGAGLGVVPVSDLAALAQQALGRHPQAASVLVCSDARMHEVYWTHCRRGEAGLVEGGVERVGPPGTVQPAFELPRPWVGVGRGFQVYPELGLRLEGEFAALEAGLLPRAREIALLARREVLAGRLLPPEEALPVYLRDDVAQPQARP